MFTSYFDKSGMDKNSVAISIFIPNWYMGKRYKELAPNEEILYKYKMNHNKNEYIEKYYKYILNNLNPKKVYEDLGENAILLCYEKQGFCHRHIVAKWLMDNLDISPICEIE